MKARTSKSLPAQPANESESDADHRASNPYRRTRSVSPARRTQWISRRAIRIAIEG